jgi:uncharacterized protein YjbJ (UPF0337 family)
MADPKREQHDPAEMRREIAETRSHMEQNINALQSRLDPDRLKNEAKTKIREQTVGRVEDFADEATETVKGTGADVFETIKQNPLPAALAAIGLGWLFMESRNSSRRRPSQRYYASGRSRIYDERSGERYPDYYEYDYDYARRRGGYEPEQMNPMRGRGYETSGMAEQARSGARQVASNVGDTANQLAGKVSDTAGQVADNVSDTASQFASNVSDTASQFAGNVSDTAGHLADTAQRSAYQAKTRFQQMLEENPLMIGAAALALGAAIGMTLPSTPQEDQLLGQARDNFMQKAQEQAKDTVDKVQQVAQKAGDAAKEAAKDEAQNQKLTTS